MVLAVIAAAMWVVVRNDDGGSSRSRSSNPSTTGIGSTVAFSSLPAFKGVDFADDLQADQKQYLAGLRQVDVGGLSAEDYQGPYTNVESDVRETASLKTP